MRYLASVRQPVKKKKKKKKENSEFKPAVLHLKIDCVTSRSLGREWINKYMKQKNGDQYFFHYDILLPRCIFKCWYQFIIAFILFIKFNNHKILWQKIEKKFQVLLYIFAFIVTVHFIFCILCKTVMFMILVISHST